MTSQWVGSVDEAAAVFGISSRTWHRWCSKLGLRRFLRKHGCLMPHGRLLAKRDSLEEAVEEWKREGVTLNCAHRRDIAQDNG